MGSGRHDGAVAFATVGKRLAAPVRRCAEVNGLSAPYAPGAGRNTRQGGSRLRAEIGDTRAQRSGQAPATSPTDDLSPLRKDRVETAQMRSARMLGGSGR